jgi:hypothetical protein
MHRPSKPRIRWLSATLALATSIGTAAAAPAGAAAGDAATLAERITALRASKSDWRAALAPTLAGLSGNRALTGRVTGQVQAATVTLPGTVELSGDTTVVARDIVAATGTVRVNSHGHALRLYPVTSLHSGAAASGTVTINTSGENNSGHNGGPGSDGSTGSDGFQGADGVDGQNGQSEYDCAGRAGEPGSPGSDGGNGNDGTRGGDGTDGGAITLDIPADATGTYQLIARGGDGGSGGSGGQGGNGGRGGQGGNGGDGYSGHCQSGGSSGGDGGNGGPGGDGGNGGYGGDGGNGGRGGNVSVTYPPSYDLAGVSIDNAGGNGGSGGIAGSGGSGGFGGEGGWGGESGEFGGPGTNGWYGDQGWTGSSAAPGSTGTAGGIGTSTFVAVEPPLSCSEDRTPIVVRPVATIARVEVAPHIRWCWRGLKFDKIEIIDPPGRTSVVIPNEWNLTVKASFPQGEGVPYSVPATGVAYDKIGKFEVQVLLETDPGGGLPIQSCAVQIDRDYPVGARSAESHDTTNCGRLP